MTTTHLERIYYSLSPVRVAGVVSSIRTKLVSLTAEIRAIGGITASRGLAAQRRAARAGVLLVLPLGPPSTGRCSFRGCPQGSRHELCNEAVVVSTGFQGHGPSTQPEESHVKCILRQRSSMVRRAAEAGMTTAEYAVGTLAACAFAAVLLAVVRSGGVKSALAAVIAAALGTAT